MKVRSAFAIAALTTIMAGLAAGCSDDQSAKAGETAAKAGVATQAVDCSTPPEGDATAALICSDPGLVALDQEAARLFKLVRSKSGSAEAGRRWEQTRSQCEKADSRRDCLVSAYAEHIRSLRSANANDAHRDDGGFSSGPFLLACNGDGRQISVTYMGTNPAIAYITSGGKGLVFERSQSSAVLGQKYEAVAGTGDGTLYTYEDQALLTLPGEKELSCEVQPGKH